MKKSFLLLFLPIFSLTISYAQIENGSFEFEGTTRDYIVFLPQNFEPNMPVVFNLHGGLAGYQAEWQMNYTMMNVVADTSGFIVVYPYSIVPYWNVNVFDPNEPDVNDIGFISTLIDTIQAKYDVDMNRIYCCGGFLGSTMTQHLLCTIGHRIAAGAGVVAPMGEYTAANCTPIRPFPIMMCYGTEDPELSWEGSRTGFMAPEDNLEFWVQNNKCVSSPDTVLLPNINLADDSYVGKIIYTNCEDESIILFYKVIGGGHSWPGACCNYFLPTNRDINASVEIWNFVKNFENPLVGIAYTESFEIISPTYKYFPSQSDTLSVNANLSNRENHQVEVYAIIKSDGSDYKDSIKLFDDGLHNDGNVSDNLYSGYKWLSNLDEDFYTVELFTNDIDMGKNIRFYLQEHFTTVGPIEIDTFSFQISSDTLLFVRNFKITNKSTVKTVENVKVEIKTSGTAVSEIKRNSANFGDIAAGDSKTVSTPFYLYIDKNVNPDSIKFEFEISSNGIVYWEIASSDMVNDTVTLVVENKSQYLPDKFVLS